jgi:hypothetical protein
MYEFQCPHYQMKKNLFVGSRNASIYQKGFISFFQQRADYSLIGKFNWILFRDKRQKVYLFSLFFAFYSNFNPQGDKKFFFSARFSAIIEIFPFHIWQKENVMKGDWNEKQTKFSGKKYSPWRFIPSSVFFLKREPLRL